MSILRANNICKSFMVPDEVQILKNISFEINEGEFVSIMGKSGCGKSTLLYILSTMDTNYTGELFLNEELNLFQIWIFPNKQNVTPRYDQFRMDTAKMHNHFLQLVSPTQADEGTWIHQDAWISMAKLEAGKQIDYSLKAEGNGVYLMLVEGEATISNQQLKQRDALGVWDTTTASIEVTKESTIVAIEVPMAF